jgi:transposase
MTKPYPHVFSREHKLLVVHRILAGESVSALSRELKVHRRMLYAWRERFCSGGPEALRGRGRPRKADGIGAVKERPASAAQQIAALERKIGQQQLELDFFRQALRQVKAARRPSDGPGVRGSMRSSKR